MSRYIDAEWLMNFFVDIPNNFTLTIGNLRATVNDAPSIDIEPKCGEWICGTDEDGNEEWTCSICGKKHPWYPNYCPHCGADMRKEGE